MSERNKGFMMIPNKMWEKLYEIRIPGQERRVFDYIYRQRLGYPLQPREVSTYGISKALGMLGCDVRDRIASLVKKNMVVRNGIFKEIQKDFTLWGVGEISPTIKQGENALVGRENTPHSVGEGSPLLKETLKEREKKGFFSKQEEEEKQKIRMEGIRSLRRNIK